jgi:hypothetical protein
MDPTGQSDSLTDVRRAQLVAMMRSFHFKIQSGLDGVSPHQTKRTRMVAMFRVEFKAKFWGFQMGKRVPLEVNTGAYRIITECHIREGSSP